VGARGMAVESASRRYRSGLRGVAAICPNGLRQC
jgi:hypothetical protein